MPEKFDFAKIEDQKKFNQLDEEDKGKIKSKAFIDAKWAEELIKSGIANDYEEALNYVQGVEHKLIICLEGGVY